MATVLIDDFEFQDISASAVVAQQSGTGVAIYTTSPRSGTYSAGLVQGGAAANAFWYMKKRAGGANPAVFASGRFYITVATLTANDPMGLCFWRDSAGTLKSLVKLNSDSTLTIDNTANGGGTATSTLTVSTNVTTAI